MSEKVSPKTLRKTAEALLNVSTQQGKARRAWLDTAHKNDEATGAVVEALCTSQLECANMICAAILDGFALVAERMEE